MLSLAYAARADRDQESTSVAVHPPCGALRGEQVDGTRIFRGVPFAQPPVGEFRFKPPIAMPAWSDVRDATHFASAPMQPGSKQLAQSEDCLYLNLWAPAESGPHPVLVWLHGGGFTAGHSFSPDQNGAKFAAQGVVCVTVEYRLGVFGFLDLEPLLGHAYAGSANNALLDIMAALNWVQANIAAFDGDPRRVTLGGQSAGAKLTDILMGVPSAERLFQQMISESGGAERVWPKQQAQNIANAFSQAWTEATQKKAEDLKSVPAHQLLDAQQSFSLTWPGDFPFRPEIDPVVLPALPITRIRSGSSRGKRLLIGTNLEESAFFLGPHPEIDPVAKQLGNMSPQQFSPELQEYQQLYPQLSSPERRIRAVTAEEYWVPSIRVADAHAQAGGSTWMYRLDFTETSGRFDGEAYHSLDLPLVWNEPHEQVANGSAEAALSLQIHAAWVAFIHGKVPAAPGLPEWPEYTASGRSTMVLNVQSHIEQNPQQEELKLWDHFLEP